jgi:Raf kinase inhibitor-like YbhB/YbcL family protein
MNQSISHFERYGYRLASEARAPLARFVRHFRVLWAAAGILLLSGFAAAVQAPLPATSGAQTAAAPGASHKPHFSLSSSGFDDGGVIPEKFTGPTPTSFQNTPPLEWINTPPGTVTFVLLLHDPEGVIDHGTDDVTHWLIYNIPGTATHLPEGIPPGAQLPDGSVQAPNQRKTPGYLGPGVRGIYHHYTFELYALDTKLNLPTDASRAQVFSAMQGHVLDKAVLVGKYMRPEL